MKKKAKKKHTSKKKKKTPTKAASKRLINIERAMYWACFVDIQLAPFSSTQDSSGVGASEGLA